MKAFHSGTIRAELHSIKGLVATLRYEPQNYCMASIEGIDGATRDHDAENARRLAAAWNACAGIPTDVLERVGAGGIRAVARSLMEHSSWHDDGTLVYEPPAGDDAAADTVEDTLTLLAFDPQPIGAAPAPDDTEELLAIADENWAAKIASV